jgi:hypothetical protein
MKISNKIHFLEKFIQIFDLLMLEASKWFYSLGIYCSGWVLAFEDFYFILKIVIFAFFTFQRDLDFVKLLFCLS